MSFRDGGIVLGAGEGKTISVLGASYTYKAAKEETRGAYALIEHTVVGDGPPRTSTPGRRADFFSWRSPLLQVFILGIVGRRSLLEPNSEFSHRVRQTPFFQDASRHRRDGARRMSALRIVQQPRLKLLRVGILLNDVFKDFPLDRETDGVRCLIALAIPSASFGGLERRQQSSTHIGWAKWITSMFHQQRVRDGVIR
jgi:hypothetical protein